MNEFQEWGMYSGALVGAKIALTSALNAYKNKEYDYDPWWLTSMISGGLLGYGLGTLILNIFRNNNMNKFQEFGTFTGGILGTIAARFNMSSQVKCNKDLGYFECFIASDSFWNDFIFSILLTGPTLGLAVGYSLGTIAGTIHDKFFATNVTAINAEANNTNNQALQSVVVTSPLLP